MKVRKLRREHFQSLVAVPLGMPQVVGARVFRNLCRAGLVRGPRVERVHGRFGGFEFAPGRCELTKKGAACGARHAAVGWPAVRRPIRVVMTFKSSALGPTGDVMPWTEGSTAHLVAEPRPE